MDNKKKNIEKYEVMANNYVIYNSCIGLLRFLFFILIVAAIIYFVKKNNDK